MTNEALFYERATTWLMRVLEQSPVAATELGAHSWDDRLGDFRPEVIEAQHQEVLAALAEFKAFDLTGFSREALIDHSLLVKILDSFVRNHDKVQGHHRDPGGYLGEALGGVFML
jgi:uncharacterized protein (DUF885 family)